MIAIDVDSTLLNEDNVLTEKTISTVQNAVKKGIKIVITSGRPTSGTVSILKKLGIFNQENQYKINYNGALTSTTAGKIISKNFLSLDDYRDIFRLSENLGLKIQAESINSIITPYNDVPEYTTYEAKLVDTKVEHIEMENLKDSDQIAEVMLMGQVEKIEKASGLLPDSFEERFSVMSSSPVYIEFTKRNVSKGEALKNLCAKLNITSKEVMAIGDQNNDISMIKFSGIGVAMGNAIPELKKVANFVTKDNNNNGVANAIDKFLVE
ncbi:MAG: Cof-type HAD-IIB family hydrolase [Oenococcus oeni]